MIKYIIDQAIDDADKQDLEDLIGKENIKITTMTGKTEIEVEEDEFDSFSDWCDDYSYDFTKVEE